MLKMECKKNTTASRKIGKKFQTIWKGLRAMMNGEGLKEGIKSKLWSE